MSNVFSVRALAGKLMAFRFIFFIALLLAIFGAHASAHAQSREPERRFFANTRGDIAFVSNSLYECRAGNWSGASNCRTAMGETGGNGRNNNWNNNLVAIDIDGDSTTQSSSAATLSFDNPSNILWAGLYWGCQATGNHNQKINKGANRVKLRAPGENYVDITADVFESGQVTNHFYQAYADVTDLMRGAGEYVLADAVCETTAPINGDFGGWTIVVAYEDELAPLRNLVAFDSFRTYGYGSTASIDIDVDGFLTPAVGDVSSRVGLVIYDGDRGQSDTLDLLSGPGYSSSYRFWNYNNSQNDIGLSAITRFGAITTDRNPAYNNTLGYDAHLFSVTNALGNSVSSARIRATGGSQEGIGIGVITFATDIHIPEIRLAKTASVLDPPPYEGSIIEYTIIAENTGDDPAIEIEIEDLIPEHTVYVPGSLRVDGLVQTDAEDGDFAHYDSTANAVHILFDEMEIDESHTITFEVEITTDEGGVTIVNTATATYYGRTIGIDSESSLSSSSDGDPTAPGTQPTIVTVGDGECGDDIVTVPGETCEPGIHGAECHPAECRYIIRITGPASGSTNGPTPTITGTGDPGEVVEILVGGVVVGTTTVQPDGSFSFTPAIAIPGGSATLTVRPANNPVSARSASQPIHIDDSTYVGLLSPPSGATIGTQTPILRGEAEPGATVVIAIDGAPVGTVIADPNGQWSFIPPASLPEGPITIGLTATDEYGNTATSSSGFTVSLDHPFISILTPPHGSTSNDETPIVSGITNPGAEVEIVIDGGTPIIVIADGDGYFSYPIPDPLGDGTHTIVVTTENPNGQASDESTFTVDPNAHLVTIDSPAHGSETNVTTPSVTGLTEPGAEVAIYLDGVYLGTTTADGSGNYVMPYPSNPGSLGLPAALPEGPHTYQVISTVGGSSSTAASVFIVDTTPPAIAITSPAPGETVATTTPTITGQTEPGLLVEIIIDGVSVGTATAGSDGSFSFTPPAPLDPGPHEVAAITSDPAGNETSSTTVSFSVAVCGDGITTPPTETCDGETHCGADCRYLVSITGPESGSTTGTTPTITGTGDPGEILVIDLGGTTYEVTVDPDGTFSFTLPAPLPGGDTPIALYPLGGDPDSPRSDETEITIDADTFVSITGPSDGSTIGNPSPTIRGEGEPGSSVTIIVDGVIVGTTTVDAEGNWSLLLPDPLDEGPHDIIAQATDPYGNEAQDEITITIDLGWPYVEIHTPSHGSTSSDPSPTIAGIANPGALVSLTLNGENVGDVIADHEGRYTFALPEPLDEGEHHLEAIVVNDRGTARDESVFTIDDGAPFITIDSPANGSATNDTTPRISGRGEPNATVELYLDGLYLGTVTVDPSGGYELDYPADPIALGLPAELPDGVHHIRAVTTTEDNETATAASTFLVNTELPSVLITAPGDGAKIGTRTPTIVGESVPYAEIEIFIDGVSVGTTTAGPTGQFSFELEEPLEYGEHGVFARATDPAGNEADSPENIFDVDPSLVDSDGDGIPDIVECPSLPDISACPDTDGDGVPDYLDPDDDGDGIPTAVECTSYPECVDTDGDGVPDYLDPDDDGDGIPTAVECADYPSCRDTDGDGVPDYLDADDDGDGIPTAAECADYPSCRDTDGDGVPDYLDPDDDGDSIPTAVECPDYPDCRDTDGDGVPDYLDPDDDGDGIPTIREVQDGAIHGNDIDGDGIPNWLDTDSDGDGIPDAEEGTEDTTGNGIPDYLDPDAPLTTRPGIAGGACSCSAPGTSGGSFGSSLFLFAFVGLYLTLRRRRLRRGAVFFGLTLALSLSSALGASSAEAQGFTVNPFRAAETASDGFAISGAEDLGHLEFGARLTLDYAFKPLVVEGIAGDTETEREALIRHLLAGNATVSLGLIDRLVVYLGVPATFYSGGDAPVGFPDADGTRIGDPYLGLRARIVGERDDLFALALQGTVSAPLSGAVGSAQNFSGERTFAFMPKINAEFRLFERRLRILANVGARIRGGSTVGNIKVGNELTFGAGAIGRAVPDLLDVIVEVYGSTGFADQPFGDRAFFGRNTTPAEVLAGVRFHPACRWDIGAAIGTGISRGYGAPKVHALIQAGYAPNPDCDPKKEPAPEPIIEEEPEPEPEPEPPVDSDGDGIPDEQDECPDEPEDLDGFEDEDGCPDLDNDGDGIPDEQDECPNEPEDLDGFEDEDGCPDLDNDGDGIPDAEDECPNAPGLPEDKGCPKAIHYDEEKGTIEILQRIEFDSGKATLVGEAAPILEEIYAVLKANPELKLILVEGHTDSRGGARLNMRLSRERARSVIRWLNERGIDAERLRARGCGPIHPITTNATAAGRQTNRRVEFFILVPEPESQTLRDRCEDIDL